MPRKISQFSLFFSRKNQPRRYPSLSLTFFLSFLMPITDSIFVGRILGEKALAASSLASTLFNMLWLVIVGGFSAFDTVGARAEGQRANG
jgi:Na+-driven multidrug efflux pump